MGKLITVKKELKCKECGKDISIKTFVLWTGHKVGEDYYCSSCYKNTVKKKK